jgi:hypothetical protein
MLIGFVSLYNRTSIRPIVKNAQNMPYFTSPSFSAWLLRDHFGKKKKKKNFDFLHIKPIQPEPITRFELFFMNIFQED